MSPHRTLVLGGTRSGKSAHAEGLLPAGGPVRYAATARRVPGDDEWDARIDAHRARRPSSWVTVESPDLCAELARPGPLLVDDLSTWLTGVLDDASAWTAAEPPAAVGAAVDALVAAVRDTPARVVLVSAEVGLGIVPESRSGRMFADRLGELNAALAGVCDEVVLVVTGIPLRLRGVPGTGSPAVSPSPPAPAPDPESRKGVVSTSQETPTVRRPDLAARREAVARVSGLAIPLGGLGSLAELGCWLSACQGECPPRPPVQARVLLVAADHGIADAGVSAYDARAGRARAEAATSARLPVTVAARAAGAAVRVVDVGLTEPAGVDSAHLVRRGTGRIDREDALTEAEAEQAYRTGQLLADEEVDAGAEVLVPASLAVAGTTPASVLVAALTGAEPVAVVGRGSGIDDTTWMRKATAVRDALRRARPYVRNPLRLLRAVGGTDIIVLAGFLARAADRGVPVVLDGLVAGAAALLAEELAPGAREWWLAAQASPEPAMTLVLEHLSLTPVLDLGVRADDGTAAVAVLPLLVTAARLLAETGTAEETGIMPLAGAPVSPGTD